jgi:hypothetical protein
MYNLLLDKDVFGELRGSVPGDLCCGTRPATKTVYVAEVVSSLTDSSKLGSTKHTDPAMG